MKWKSLIASILPCLLTCARAAEKPNILWITSEDNAFHWLGCYGNDQVRTPRMDALAQEGVRFTHAYSNAPVCAVARSTILNGAYAPTQGTHQMRSRYPIPDAYRSNVHYLREAGYYCTNQSKTDYNFKGNDNAIWDACSNKAHYRNRKPGQPFFCVLNLTVSHESSLFADKISSLYGNGKKPSLAPDEVTPPPYLPDLPGIREDLAAYHDIIAKLDMQVGGILDDLAKDGLAEETIVFYYSDHGGILPRGKRYLYDTGVRVPMIVRVPEKWKHLSPFPNREASGELVSFVDLAPTVLSLAGIETPAQMQGRAFLGTKRKEPAKDDHVFLYADRFDEKHSGVRRGLTNGRWKYIRRFDPSIPAAPYSYYQFGQSGWRAWRQAWRDGSLDPKFRAIWESPQPVEELYDTVQDPWEIHNLATDSAHAERLADMRGKLRNRMIETRDMAVVPEPLYAIVAADRPVADFMAEHADDLPALVDLMFRASSGDPQHLQRFLPLLESDDLLMRYWAAAGCRILGKAAKPASSAFQKLLDDPVASIRIEAAQALEAMGQPSVESIVRELDKKLHPMETVHALSALVALKAVDQIPQKTLRRIAKSKSEYASRFASVLLNQHD